MDRIQDVFKNCKEYVLTCGSFLSALWSSTKFRSLFVFSFLLLTLPVVVISALRVTKYQEHAASPVQTYTSMDGVWKITMAPLLKSFFSIGEPIYLDVEVQELQGEGIGSSIYDSQNPSAVNTLTSISIECDVFGKDGSATSGLYSSFQTNTTTNGEKIVYLFGPASVSQKDYDTWKEHPNQFFLSCFATWQAINNRSGSQVGP